MPVTRSQTAKKDISQTNDTKNELALKKAQKAEAFKLRKLEIQAQREAKAARKSDKISSTLDKINDLKNKLEEKKAAKTRITFKTVDSAHDDIIFNRVSHNVPAVSKDLLKYQQRLKPLINKEILKAISDNGSSYKVSISFKTEYNI